jgi:hypothetical protein
MTEGMKATRQTFEPGFVVEVWTDQLNRDRAEHGHVGQVQAVDGQGVRLSQIDWAIGNFSNWDIFIPWGEIRWARMATPEHDATLFVKELYARLRNKKRDETE